ncbi:MAG: protein kinase [Phycisphaerae bacterium]|nr:protein kinase [Phycisphaerae bacterium]
MLSIGEKLQHYRISDLLESGGEGDVYRAEPVRGGGSVVIKHLRLDPKSSSRSRQIDRFRRSASVRIQHPNVLGHSEYLVVNDEHYLISPFIDGVDLSDWVRRFGGAAPLTESLPLLTSLARGLACIHANHIVHRDLKPANVMVRPPNDPVIIDFGISRWINQPTLSGDGIVGTPGWMSPEQTQCARVDARSDLFAFGLIMFFVLTGRRAIECDDAADAIRRVQQADLRSPRCLISSIPKSLDAICARLLHRDPARRFSSARAVCEALDARPSEFQFCIACSESIDARAIFCTQCGASQSPPIMGELRCLACRAPVGELLQCPSCTRPFGVVEHRLVMESGGSAGWVFRIPEGIYVIGRNQLDPADLALSRRHAVIRCSNGSVFVADAGSANRTRVNGQILALEQRLTPASNVTLGQSRATYHTS